MEELKFRDLRADEIEVRVGMAKQNGVSLLLYKNARCDMNILDETVGANQWQRKHYECKNNLYCSVGIKFPDGWIWKDDCGAESNMEKQKGEASDAFKRACVNWGIGRELYTSPFIWIGSDACEIKQNGNKFYCKDTFSVLDILTVDKTIVRLKLMNNRTGNLVFSWSAVTCPKCGKLIRPFVGASGYVYQPAQILEKYGYCPECKKAEREASNAAG